MWRARRGLLENDIILKRFFSKYQKDLSEGEWLALEELLDETDNELLDIILGIKKLNEDALSPETLSILFKLRSC
jgi:antitoxin CptB